MFNVHFLVNPRTKPHSIRQDLPAKLKADLQQDYLDFFELVYLYPVNPVDPVRKWTVYGINFNIGLNWPLFRPAAVLV